MATIVPRKRKDGSTGYLAQIIIKRGKVAHRESQTFDRRQAAVAWSVRREEELRKPGALGRKIDDPKLADVIDRYVAESEKQIGRTKAQVLRKIKTFDVAELRCREITSADLISMAQALPVTPQTRMNYMSHLAAVFAVARPMWGYPLDQQAIKDAFTVAKRMGVTSKGASRDRRPTIEELDRLMDHFADIKTRRPSTLPMQRIIPFAIFSTRRQEEIVRILWADYQPPDHGHSARVMVRDMKNPGDKIGNNVWCDLPSEASAYIEAMPRSDDRIFPYSTDGISAAFTRACQVLGIEDLHFHDLRHEGVSRLFEIGWNIPQVATVSGHRSSTSLKRYSHLRQSGDKYIGWKWLAPQSPPIPSSRQTLQH
jgi:integrase